MISILVFGLFSQAYSLYDCEAFKQKCQNSCGADSQLSFSCQSNATPGNQIGLIVVEEIRAGGQKGGSHQCACENQSLESCFDYTQFCETECGGQNFIKQFTCDLEKLPDLSVFSQQTQLLMECQCQDDTISDQFNSYQPTNLKQTDKNIDLPQISYNITYDPAKSTINTAQIASALQQAISKTNEDNCFDYLPVSEGYCEDRVAWGSCDESWMSEKYYCAKSCGFCDQPESKSYDCFVEYNSCYEVCNGDFEFACYRQMKKTDCTCQQKGTQIEPQQNEVYVDDMNTINGVNVYGDQGCHDFLPAKEGTCRNRVLWNSCSENWMKEKNYCAKSCGFCQSEVVPIIVDTQAQNEEQYEWIDAHNQFRRKHCVQNLKWSSILASEAQNMADQCDMVDNNQRSWNFFRSVGMDQFATPFKIVESWYKVGQKNGLNFNAPVFSKEIAPTSKVIWKSSKEVGCGMQQCGGQLYAYCIYDPPGNILNNFQNEVLPTCQ